VWVMTPSQPSQEQEGRQQGSPEALWYRWQQSQSARSAGSPATLPARHGHAVAYMSRAVIVDHSGHGTSHYHLPPRDEAGAAAGSGAAPGFGDPLSVQIEHSIYVFGGAAVRCDPESLRGQGLTVRVGGAPGGAGAGEEDDGLAAVDVVALPRQSGRSKGGGATAGGGAAGADAYECQFGDTWRLVWRTRITPQQAAGWLHAGGAAGGAAADGRRLALHGMWDEAAGAPAADRVLFGEALPPAAAGEAGAAAVPASAVWEKLSFVQHSLHGRAAAGPAGVRSILSGLSAWFAARAGRARDAAVSAARKAGILSGRAAEPAAPATRGSAVASVDLASWTSHSGAEADGEGEEHLSRHSSAAVDEAVASDIHPSPRTHAAMAVSDGGHSLLLFGGALCSPGCNCMGEAWKLSVPPVTIIRTPASQDTAADAALLLPPAPAAAGAGASALARRAAFDPSAPAPSRNATPDQPQQDKAEAAEEQEEAAINEQEEDAEEEAAAGAPESGGDAALQEAVAGGEGQGGDGDAASPIAEAAEEGGEAEEGEAGEKPGEDHKGVDTAALAGAGAATEAAQESGGEEGDLGVEDEGGDGVDMELAGADENSVGRDVTGADEGLVASAERAGQLKDVPLDGDVGAGEAIEEAPVSPAHRRQSAVLPPEPAQARSASLLDEQLELADPDAASEQAQDAQPISAGKPGARGPSKERVNAPARTASSERATPRAPAPSPPQYARRPAWAAARSPPPFNAPPAHPQPRHRTPSAVTRRSPVTGAVQPVRRGDAALSEEGDLPQRDGAVDSADVGRRDHGEVAASNARGDAAAADDATPAAHAPQARVSRQQWSGVRKMGLRPAAAARGGRMLLSQQDGAATLRAKSRKRDKDAAPAAADGSGGVEPILDTDVTPTAAADASPPLPAAAAAAGVAAAAQHGHGQISDLHWIPVRSSDSERGAALQALSARLQRVTAAERRQAARDARGDEGDDDPDAEAEEDEGTGTQEREDEQTARRSREAEVAPESGLRPSVRTWLQAAFAGTPLAVSSGASDAEPPPPSSSSSTSTFSLLSRFRRSRPSVGVDSPPSRYRHSLVSEYRRHFLASLVRGATLLERLRFLSFSHGMSEALEGALLRQVMEVVEAEEEHHGRGDGSRPGAAAGLHSREAVSGGADSLSSAAVLFGGETYQPESQYFDDTWLWLQQEEEGAISQAIADQERAAQERSARISFQRHTADRQVAMARWLILLGGGWLAVLALCAVNTNVKAAARAACRRCCRGRMSAGAHKHATVSHAP